MEVDGDDGHIWTMTAILIWTSGHPTQWTILTIQGTVTIIMKQGVVWYMCPVVLNVHYAAYAGDYFVMCAAAYTDNYGG